MKIDPEARENFSLIQQAPAEDKQEFGEALKTYLAHPNAVDISHDEVRDLLDREGVKGLTAKMREVQNYGGDHKSFSAARAKEQKDRYKRLSRPGGF